ncbi:MAG: class I SAM-dependent methyltransferase [Lacibacter sp.]
MRLGFFTLYHELKGEKKYRINTTSFNNLSRFTIKGDQLAHATEYMPVSYFTIEQLFSHLPEKAKTETFLDIGCGKGRAMCIAAHYGFNNVSGIDFAKEMIDAAAKNLAGIKELFPHLQYELSWADITTLEIGKEVSTVFLFNPFDEILMKSVIQKIKTSLKNYPRAFHVMYASPRHEDLFFAAGFDVIFRVKKLNYLEGIVLQISEKLR